MMQTTRRKFIGTLGAFGVAAAGGGLRGACGGGSDDDSALAAASTATEPDATATEAMSDEHSGDARQPVAGKPSKRWTPHEAGITSFPAETAGLGGQPLEYEMDGDVKVFA
ncbi:MAG: hypothetical protein R2849_09995 [Thermomicrobiales bacterium]